MACKIIYNFPYQNPDPVSDCSQSAYKQFVINPCDNNLLYPPTCDGLWNNNLCENDKPYYTPFCETLTGNLLYFQFRFFIPLISRNLGWRLSGLQEDYFLDIAFYDDCCELLDGVNPYDHIENANTFRVGLDHFQNLIINTTDLPDKFIISITTSNGDTSFINPFERDCCNELFSLEGVYTEFGCDGSYYAVPESVDTGFEFAFRNFFYALGSIDKDNYTIEKTTNRNNVLGVKRNEDLRLQTLELPPYAFNQLVEVLSAKEIAVKTNSIDNKYNFAGSVSGLSNSNRMYKPEISLTRIDCEQNLKC